MYKHHFKKLCIEGSPPPHFTKKASLNYVLFIDYLQNYFLTTTRAISKASSQADESSSRQERNGWFLFVFCVSHGMSDTRLTCYWYLAELWWKRNASPVKVTVAVSFRNKWELTGDLWPVCAQCQKIHEATRLVSPDPPGFPCAMRNWMFCIRAGLISRLCAVSFIFIYSVETKLELPV